MNFKNNVSPVLRFVDRFWIGMYLGTVIIVSCVHPLFFTPITSLFGPEVLDRWAFMYYSAVIFGVLLIVYRFFIAHQYRPAHLMQLWLIVPIACVGFAVSAIDTEDRYAMAGIRSELHLSHFLVFDPAARIPWEENTTTRGFNIYRCNHLTFRCDTYWAFTNYFPVEEESEWGISCPHHEGHNCRVIVEDKAYHVEFNKDTGYLIYCIYENKEPIRYEALGTHITNTYAWEHHAPLALVYMACAGELKPAPLASGNPTP